MNPPQGRIPVLLRHALRLSAAPVVVATGAGGKSSLLFAAAREYPAALVTTTVYAEAQQIAWADTALFVRNPQELAAVEAIPPSGVTFLLSGPPVEEGRAPGISADTLRALLRLARRRSLPLFIEADNACQRPLNVPSVHASGVPFARGESHTHLVLAGLSALGRSLDAACVHHPEIFSRLSGLPPGAPLTAEAVGAVLRHLPGGLKDVPRMGGRRVAVLTQALTPQQQAAGGRLAESLLGAYRAVLLAETRPAPRGTPSPLLPLAVWEKRAAVVLAAGRGERIGRPKALLSWRGRPFVWHVVQSAFQGGYDPVIVVTGAEGDAVRRALRGLPVRLVENPRWREGQGTSVAAGAAALPAETGAAVFLLVDQPHVSPALLRALSEEHLRTLAPVIAPLVDGRRATPVLFDRSAFADLRSLRGAQGGRALFSRYRLHYLPWHDPLLLLDVDTADDYRRLLDEAP